MRESMYKEEIIVLVTFNMLKNNLKNALTDVSSKHQEHVQVLKI